jgi:3-isopropylmalate/(R)-2-methylmalate dehydratase small subunit
MERFDKLTSIAVPIDRDNVDTDAILPKQYMAMIGRTGFGAYLFDEWRYFDRGEPGMDASRRQPNPDFPLNQPRFAGAQIMLCRTNFGCGSSREHAPWALAQWGIRALVGVSFADIFYGNCIKNGILPVCLSAEHINTMFTAANRGQDNPITIDLGRQQIRFGDDLALAFTIDSFQRDLLMNGLDEIGQSLLHQDEIRKFEFQRMQREPWLFRKNARST